MIFLHPIPLAESIEWAVAAKHGANRLLQEVKIADRTYLVVRAPCVCLPALRQMPGSIGKFGLRRARSAKTQAGSPRRGLHALTIAIGEGPLLREKRESALARVLFLIAHEIATRAIARTPPKFRQLIQINN